MRAEIINVGTELLIGSTLNTHQQYLAQELGKLGIDLYTAVTIGDNPQRLAASLTAALFRSDLVILTGGLGPTDDDITVKATARTLGLDLLLSPAVRDAIGSRLRHAGRPLNAFQIRQAHIPRGARTFSNPYGTAPGIFITVERMKKNHHVVLLPGPPRELRPMVQNHLIPLLKKLLGPARSTLVVKRLYFPGAVESEVAPRVNDWLNAPPPVTVGIYAKAGEVELTVMSKHVNAVQAERSAKRAENQILRRFRGQLILKHPETLVSFVANRLTRSKKTLALAESCTGGLLAGRVTDVPGSSVFFLGGVIAYDNAVKRDILGVAASRLLKHGAVSPQTAQEMAQNTKKLFGSDYALSVTGIAGPGGGSASKPVGLVYIALAEPGKFKKPKVFRHRFFGSRSDVRTKAVQSAFTHLARALSPKTKKR